MNIIKVLAVLVLLYVGYKIVTMFQRVKSQEVKGFRVDAAPPAGEDLVQDPFCKIYVPKSHAYLKEIDGRRQYFCSKECCEKYLSDKK
jgi:YHS domain-containing protein